jgi:hypothetical protein
MVIDANASVMTNGKHGASLGAPSPQNKEQHVMLVITDHVTIVLFGSANNVDLIRHAACCCAAQFFR